ncbi:hypothetical protein H632_c3124p0, partial [Helicosporidium sp. ATCC 50920]
GRRRRRARRRARALQRGQGPGDAARQKRRQNHFFRRGWVRRGQDRDHGVCVLFEKARQVPRSGSQDSSRSPAGRPPRHGQDAPGQGHGGRGGRAVLVHLGLGLHGDVRGRGPRPRARPLRAGSLPGARHHLHRRDRRHRPRPRPRRLRGRQRRAREHAEPAAGGDGRLPHHLQRRGPGRHQPARHLGQSPAASRQVRSADLSGSAGSQGPRADLPRAPEAAQAGRGRRALLGAPGRPHARLRRRRHRQRVQRGGTGRRPRRPRRRGHARLRGGRGPRHRRPGKARQGGLSRGAPHGRGARGRARGGGLVPGARRAAAQGEHRAPRVGGPGLRAVPSQRKFAGHRAAARRHDGHGPGRPRRRGDRPRAHLHRRAERPGARDAHGVHAGGRLRHEREARLAQLPARGRAARQALLGRDRPADRRGGARPRGPRARAGARPARREAPARGRPRRRAPRQGSALHARAGGHPRA